MFGCFGELYVASLCSLIEPVGNRKRARPGRHGNLTPGRTVELSRNGSAVPSGYWGEDSSNHTRAATCDPYGRGASNKNLKSAAFVGNGRSCHLKNLPVAC